MASWSISAGFAAGLLSFFLGERIIRFGEGRWLVSGMGLAVMLGALVLRARSHLRSRGTCGAVIERILLVATGGAVVSVALYFVTRLDAMAERPKLDSVLFALWTSGLACSCLVVLFTEWALRGYRKVEPGNLGRVREASLAGASVALVLILAISVVFNAQAFDFRWDFSGHRTTQASPASRAVVRNLEHELEVALFFPPASEVGDEVTGYFRGLSSESRHLLVRRYDFPLALREARELHVLGNGYVALRSGSRLEHLWIGVERSSARVALKELDTRIQRVLLQLVRPARVAYATFGHGEGRGSSLSLGGAADSMGGFMALLAAQNLIVRPLGPVEGLANEVPEDAAFVVVMGPTSRFRGEEIASLARYFRRGGRLFIALDPESGIDLGEFLEPLGVRYRPELLVNDQVHLAPTAQVSDQRLLLTSSFGAHIAIHELLKLGNRAPVIFKGAGYFEQLGSPLPDASYSYLVKAHEATFNDLNRDFQFDPPEESRREWEMAAALWVAEDDADSQRVERGRLILVGDSNAFDGDMLRNLGNVTFVLDAVRWLLGDENVASGAVVVEEPPLLLTRGRNLLWFYLTIMGMPVAVLLSGLWVLHLRRERARRGSEAAR